MVTMRQQHAVKELFDTVTNELSRPVSEGLKKLAKKIIAPKKARAVLFYGSGLWGPAREDTIYDFYIIVDDYKDWQLSRPLQWLNQNLPPHVEYHAYDVAGKELKAKIAVLSMTQFWQRTGLFSLDTTIWARFSQPARLLYTFDEKSRRGVTYCVMRACMTASLWASFLGKDCHSLGDLWARLYRQTYRAELRVEKKGRQHSIIEASSGRYAYIYGLCWSVLGRHASMEEILKSISGNPSLSKAMQEQWRLRRTIGGMLNFMRLVKAAYSFENGAEYILWKIHRHTGIAFELTTFRKKHPIIASLPILFYLWRHKIIRH